MIDVRAELAVKFRDSLVRVLEGAGFEVTDGRAWAEPGDLQVQGVSVDDLVGAVVALVAHRCLPAEWSAISGDGVLDVRGSKADIDVVVSWRRAKDRLAWFEEEYKKFQEREAELKRRLDVSEAERALVSKAAELISDGDSLKSKYDRLLTAFHDATRRHMGVTPDSGLEFYDHSLADEAEARRTRYGRGPK